MSGGLRTRIRGVLQISLLPKVLVSAVMVGGILWLFVVAAHRDSAEHFLESHGEEISTGCRTEEAIF